MKVLITGGAGYIGSHCNRYFAEKGVETVVLDDLSSGHREAVTDGRFVEGDFGDRGLLDKVLGAEKFDGIIHFAAFIDVAESVAEPAKYYENNVVKMKTLLDAAVAHGVKQFVFSSTAAVFGEPEYVPIDEAHPKKPINAYGDDFNRALRHVYYEDYDNNVTKVGFCKYYGLKDVLVDKK